MTDNRIYGQTREFLIKFEDFLSRIKEEPGREDSDAGIFESDIISLVKAAGRAEGRRLKGWGLMSGELEEVFHEYAASFGVTCKLSGPLKLPFEGIGMKVQNKNRFSREMWMEYASSLLSVYGMNEIHIDALSSPEEGEEYEIRRIPAGEPASNQSIETNDWIREYTHKMNNYLGGIISFASLISSTKKDKERADLIIDSAKNIEKLIKEVFPKKK